MIPERASFRRPPAIAAAILAAAGVALGLWLTVAHFRAGHTALGAGCPLGDVFDCALVDASPHSEIGGVPVAILAQAGFAALASLALALAIAERADARPIAGALVLAAAAGTGFAAYLLGVSALVIGAFCGLCLALDLLVAAILACALAAVPRPFQAVREALPRLPLRPEVWCAVVVLVGLAGLLQKNYGSSVARAAELSISTFDRRFDLIPVEKVPARSAASAPAPALGPETAPVTIEVFSDFECPHCRRMAQWLHDLHASAPDRTRLVFRHYPLNSDCNPRPGPVRHTNACTAAYAAEAARAQGRFWELHDGLMGGPLRLKPDVIDAAAGAAGLDPVRFGADRHADPVKLAVLEDMKAGATVKITGVPTLFVNGRRLGHVRSADEIRRAVDRELARRKE